VGAIDLDSWNEDITSAWGGSLYMYIKYLGMTDADTDKYITKLKTAGFRAVAGWNGDETDELYNYLFIDGKLYRVAVERRENRELMEFVYKFKYYENGIWPKTWQDGGLPAPDKYDAIVGAIDLDSWNEDITSAWGGSSYMYIKYLVITADDADKYIAKLKTAGFTQIESFWRDDVELENNLFIDGKSYRVTIEHRENSEITEFLYKFKYNP